MYSIFRIFLVFILIFTSCLESDPNEETKKVVDQHQINEYDLETLPEDLHKVVYVPIYSDIYNQTKDSRVLLTATLSLRNTSETDTLFISRVEYFDTKGKSVRNYIENAIYLSPLESLDFVVEEKDDTGGSGANFLIDWYSHREINPIFQAVMTGGLAGRAFAFTTQGVEVK